MLAGRAGAQLDNAHPQLGAHAVSTLGAAPSAALLQTLAALHERATVYVVSGRPADVLDEWLGDLGIGLVCEHGLAVKHPGGSWIARAELDPQVLMDTVLPVLQDFVDRTPGSMIEEKKASVAWHYRASDFKLGSWRAKELLLLLSHALQNLPFVVLRGSRVVEVRPLGVTKGHAVVELLAKYTGADLVVCAGNDRTDEDMFEALDGSAVAHITCHVGTMQSAARYCLDDPSAFRSFLGELAAALPEAEGQSPRG